MPEEMKMDNDVNDADRAQALADRFWEELLEREPVFATAIGDERYDDRLPDVSEESRARSETRNRAALDELATIDREGLDITLRTTMDVLEAIAVQALAALELRTDRLYVANHFVGPGVVLADIDRKSTRLNSSHTATSRMPSSA